MSVLVAVHASIDDRLENVHEVTALVVVVDRPKRREIDTVVGISDDTQDRGM